MASFGQITDKLFTQCMNLLGSEKNQRKLKNHIIDPLVTYFKHRLRFFFVIITIFLILIIGTNIFLIYHVWILKSAVSAMNTMSSVSSSVIVPT